MTSIDFIHIKLKELVQLFPTVRARYDYDMLSDTHSVEVVPSNLYYNDDNFNDWQTNVLLKFMSLYGDESLCFISDDSIVGIEKIDFEVLGSKYNVIPTTNTTDIFFTYVDQQPIWDLFNAYQPNNFTAAKTNEIKFACLPNEITLGKINAHLQTNLHGDLIDTIKSDDKDPTYSNYGDNNYALAA